MLSETFRYPPVGRCIYCGATENLTDEHIIPFSLGGVLILPAASCNGRDGCNKKTHRFEGVVARQIFGKFRARHGIQTRRPKERPTHFEYSTSVGPRLVKATDHPTELFIYKFYEPNAYHRMPRDFDTSTKHWVPVSICSDHELKTFMQAHNWDGRITFVPRPYEYAQLLAKIGYSFAVANFGLDAFKPYVTDLILGRETNFSFCVGGDWEVPPPQPDGGHVMTFSYREQDGGLLVSTHIRLFASCGTPQYHVAVGKAESREQIRTLMDKLRDAKEVKITFPNR